MGLRMAIGKTEGSYISVIDGNWVFPSEARIACRPNYYPGSFIITTTIGVLGKYNRGG